MRMPIVLRAPLLRQFQYSDGAPRTPVCQSNEDEKSAAASRRGCNNIAFAQLNGTREVEALGRHRLRMLFRSCFARDGLNLRASNSPCHGSSSEQAILSAPSRPRASSVGTACAFLSRRRERLWSLSVTKIRQARICRAHSSDVRLALSHGLVCGARQRQPNQSREWCLPRSGDTMLNEKMGFFECRQHQTVTGKKPRNRRKTRPRAGVCGAFG